MGTPWEAMHDSPTVLTSFHHTIDYSHCGKGATKAFGEELSVPSTRVPGARPMILVRTGRRCLTLGPSGCRFSRILKMRWLRQLISPFLSPFKVGQEAECLSSIRTWVRSLGSILQPLFKLRTSHWQARPWSPTELSTETRSVCMGGYAHETVIRPSKGMDSGQSGSSQHWTH